MSLFPETQVLKDLFARVARPKLAKGILSTSYALQPKERLRIGEKYLFFYSILQIQLFEAT